MSLITIPASPAAPADVEFTLVSAVAMTRSPFTGAQQVFDWGGQWLEARVTLPPLVDADAINWLSFFRQLRGPANTFHFTAAFGAAYPWLLQAGSPPAALTWRLKGNSLTFSLPSVRLFGFSFEIVQAI